jgi:hypothetical protein
LELDEDADDEDADNEEASCDEEEIAWRERRCFLVVDVFLISSAAVLF